MGPLGGLDGDAVAASKNVDLALKAAAAAFSYLLRYELQPLGFMISLCAQCQKKPKYHSSSTLFIIN